jgi:hypothetical protein
MDVNFLSVDRVEDILPTIIAAATAAHPAAEAAAVIEKL